MTLSRLGLPAFAVSGENVCFKRKMFFFNETVSLFDRLTTAKTQTFDKAKSVEYDKVIPTVQGCCCMIGYERYSCRASVAKQSCLQMYVM